MTDHLIRGIYPQHNLRFAYARTTRLCTEGIGLHQCDYVSGWLLGEALLCSVLMSVMVKDDEKLTLNWSYPGPIGGVYTDLNELGQVRGYTRKVRLLPEITTLDQAMGGQGQISVMNSTARTVVRTGITPAVFMSISRDLAHFMSLSYQVETGLAIGLHMPPVEPASFSLAQGFLLQPLPGADLEVFDTFRRRLEAPDTQSWLEEAPRDVSHISQRLGLEHPSELNTLTPSYTCGCSREKVLDALTLLGADELSDIMEKDGQAQVACHFCATQYIVNLDELKTLLARHQTQPS